MAWTLSEILAPISEEGFLAKFWGREFTHISGTEKRFVPLFPWEMLNDVLAKHRMPPSRFSVYHRGLRVHPDRYQTRATNRLKSRELLCELENGATLVMDHVEECSETLFELVSDVERVTRTDVHVNLYAGWKGDHGFGIHFDHQDTMILQIYGRKRWHVWGPSRLHPLRPDIEEADAPKADPIWSGLLEDGSMLYIPRGWWHTATPVNEPCLHLTVTINNPSGLDLLKWLADEMRRHEITRQSLPYLQGTAERARYLEELFQAFQSYWNEDLLDRYSASQAADRASRPAFNLPSLQSRKP